MERHELFSQVLAKIKDGMHITFSRKNVAEGDSFLILYGDDTCTVTFHTKRVPYWVEFDNDEPMLLENCPTSFLESILKNV